jgi:hypothetical protein
MRRSFAGCLISFLFLSILFVKTAIVLTPFVISHFNRDTVNELIMQLEENNQKGPESTKENVAKEFYSTTSIFNFSEPFFLIEGLFSPEEVSIFCMYYPSIPTPPPNLV